MAGGASVPAMADWKLRRLSTIISSGLVGLLSSISVISTGSKSGGVAGQAVYYKRQLLRMASIYAIGNQLAKREGMILLSVSEDHEIFHALIRSVQKPGGFPDDWGELLLAVGTFFLGTPFAPRTLEQ